MANKVSNSRDFLFTLVLIPFLVAGLFSPCLAGPDEVLARIGNETITEGDLDRVADAVPDKSRTMLQTPEGKKEALEYMVNIYVLAAEAQNQGLDKTPEIQKLIEFTKKDLLARLYLDKMTPNPTDKEISDFYEQNKERFATPETINLHHILVKTEKEAKDALEKIKKGAKFADVAKQVSTCPSKGKGGDLDWTGKGSLVKEIEDVAYPMEKGQLAGPVQTKFGWHVLFLNDKRPAGSMPLDQLKGLIIDQLRSQKQQEQYDSIVDGIKKKMNIQLTAPAAPAGSTAAPKN